MSNRILPKNQEAAFFTALDNLFLSPVWLMIKKADQEARHEGVTHQMERVDIIANKYGQRFMRREMARLSK